MKIKEMLYERNNDFTATLECEHCGHEYRLTTGYHDNHYHTRVIPALTCGQCGKNRAGVVPTESNHDGRKPVL